MNYGHKIKIVDKVMSGGETTLEIDGLPLLHVVAHSVSREVDELAKVTFTVYAESVSVDHEGRK